MLHVFQKATNGKVTKKSIHGIIKDALKKVDKQTTSKDLTTYFDKEQHDSQEKHVHFQKQHKCMKSY